MFEKYMLKQEGIDAINIALAVLDKSGKILLLNRQGSQFFTQNNDSVIGSDFFELSVDKDKLKDTKTTFNRVMSDDTDALDMLRALEAQDISKKYYLDWEISVLRDKNGVIDGALCLGIDITKQRETEKILQFKSEEQSALNSILRISLEDIELEEQLQKALDILLGLSWLPIAPKGGIFQVDEKSDTLILKVQTGLNPEIQTACARVPFGHCLCGRAAASREIQYACCLDKRHEITFDGIKPHGHYNIPILSKNGVLGVIVVYLEHGHERDEREVKFFGAVANTLAGLIEHRRTQDDLYSSREKLSEAQQIAHLGGLEWSIADGEIKLSKEAELITGVFSSSKKLTMETFLNIVHPDDRDSLMEALERAVEKGEAFSMDYHIQRLDGERRAIHSYAKPIYGNTGKIVGIRGTLQDITQRKELEEKLSQSAAVFENTSEAVMIMDIDKKIISINRAFTDITGYTEKDILTKRSSVLRSDRHDEEFYESIWRRIYKNGNWQGELWSKRKDGDVFPQWTNISVVKDSEGVVSSYVCVFSDISSIKESQNKLDYLAHHDPLTDLPNRLLFNARVEQSLASARRNKTLLAVLFLDLDHFKNINDTLGHPIGDLLLKEVSSRLIECVREEDIVSRLGGDEFSILLEEMHDPNFASIVARKIIGLLSKKYILDNHEVFVTCSVGISIFPNDGDDITTLLKNADSALYRAKDQGRNTYQYYTEELSIRAMERMMMENSLRYALERNELIVYYQPQVDLYSGHIIGMEALLRWQHPEIGLIPPNDFIPLAEETGLIIPIGEWVLRTACARLQSWIESGFPKMRMAVNLSSCQFNQRNLPEVISNILQETGLDPTLLEIELTERIVMSDAEKSVKMITDLKKLNIQLSIDDFGTGYSSLSYLKKFPIDRIKIDKSFVNNIISDSEDAAISQAIISMSHGMSLKTIAEGVETVEQLEFLRSRKCDEVQGFYFSKPLPETDIERLLRDGTKVYTQQKIYEEEKHLLLVSDEKWVTDKLLDILNDDNYEITAVSTQEEAINILAVKRIDVIVVDDFMPKINGIGLLSKLQKLYPDTVRILLIKYSDPGIIARAINESGVYKVVSKPWLDEQLRDYVKSAFSYQKSTLPRRSE